MICNQITGDFSNVKLSSSPLKQNVPLRYGQKRCKYKKIRLHYHKTQMSGVCSSNFNIRYKLYNVNVERSRSIELSKRFLLL